MESLADAVSPWHDFYMLVGTASATLVGLLFVAASVGSGVFTKDKHPALRAFLSPSVFHFTSVLAACLIAMAPIRSWVPFGLLIGGEALFGIAYAGLVSRNIVRHGYIATIDLADRLWYAALPAVGYAILAAAGVALLLQRAEGCALIALATGALLLVGIRNAWDMTIFTVIQRRE